MKKGFVNDNQRKAVMAKLNQSTGSKTEYLNKYSEEKEFIKLEKPLLHGTSVRKAKYIEKEGLCTNCETVHEYSKGEGRQGVYITPDFLPALWYARDASAECPSELIEHCEDFDENNMAIIEIHSLPTDAVIKKDPLSRGDIIVEGDIPPQCINVYYPNDIRKKIKHNDIFEYLYLES